ARAGLAVRLSAGAAADGHVRRSPLSLLQAQRLAVAHGGSTAAGSKRPRQRLKLWKDGGRRQGGRPGQAASSVRADTMRRLDYRINADDIGRASCRERVEI